MNPVPARFRRMRPATPIFQQNFQLLMGPSCLVWLCVPLVSIRSVIVIALSATIKRYAVFALACAGRMRFDIDGSLLPAGLAAALASVFGKLALDPNFLGVPTEVPLLQIAAIASVSLSSEEQFSSSATNMLSMPREQTCHRLGVADLCHQFGVQFIYLLRAASLGLLVVSNIVMTTTFTRAMHLTSSFKATVATTSFNYSFTAILSMVVFGETLPPLW